MIISVGLLISHLFLSNLGAACILEAPTFPSGIGSGGVHKAARFIARLFFSGLSERLLFFVPGYSQEVYDFGVLGPLNPYTGEVYDFWVLGPVQKGSHSHATD